MIESLLMRLDAWLVSHRPGYYQHLRPGLDEGEIDRLETRVGVHFPAALRDLYQWHDGQRDDCYMGLQFNRSFTPLADVLSTKETLDEMIGYDFTRRYWWLRGWLPFLHNGGGDYLCLDLSAEIGGTPGQIIEFWHDWENRSILYPNLQSWLEVFVESLEADMWEDEGGSLQPKDDGRWEKLNTERCPGYPIKRDAGDEIESTSPH